jgi:hypothetical protein
MPNTPDNTPFSFPIEAGHVLQFARAIGDPAQDYYTAATHGAAKPPAVPPTFVQASTTYDPASPVRPSAAGTWAPSKDAAIALHAEQHYEYHRPLRPGTVLTVQARDGARWSKQGRRGELSFEEAITDYRDADGHLVVTARSVKVTLPVRQDEA